MSKLKKLGIVSLSTAMSLGIFAPSVGATNLNEQQDQIQIRIAQFENTVTKQDLIEKVEVLFPNKFDFLQDSDYHMSSGHRFPNDETIRYDLNFHKEMNGKQVHGQFGFVGEELAIENFYYQPATTAEALFPAKVTENEAEEIAFSFLKQFSNESEYQLDTANDYYPGNRTLIEPIRYSFSFVRTEQQIPIYDQRVQITVLGNGEIIEFYRQAENNNKHTYDDGSEVLPEDEVLAKVKENLAIDLQYKIDYNFQTGEPYVQLVYQPINNGLGIHALSGEWQTADGFSPELQANKEIELITTKQLEPRDNEFSLEKAKAFANELLTIDSEKVKLMIESVEERENHLGKEVINIQYMYEYANGGHGATLELDKQTGEIIQYHDIKRDVLRQLGEEINNGKTVSRNDALEKALSYLKKFAPSYLHNYAQPLVESSFDEMQGYHFSFPRVVDGILVNGDQISVSVGEDGSLVSLNVNQQQIENWPTRDEIISKQEATAAFTEKLSLDLRYVKATNGKEDNHYHIVYFPLHNGDLYSFIDANTGEWNETNTNKEDRQEVSHPWAEEELNYLIYANILELDDEQLFDADAPVTKGDALKIVMKSLTPFYDIYYSEYETSSQSFDNITPEHPLYQVIERAVTMGILKTENQTIDVDAPLTREELAVWYVRALGLDQAAKHSGIYNLDFIDKDKVEDKNIGHVALANSFGLLSANNGRFNPDGEVTYSQIAVSIFRLAKEAYERNPQRYY